MSFRRRQSTVANRNVYLDNRLTTFTNPPIYTGDLYVERNEHVAGNLDVSGNLTVEKDINAVNFRATGNYYLDAYVLIPAGTIIQSAAINTPNGWFDCNGQLLLRTVYGDLFDAISYTYSSFSGTDLSFNVPDMRGRVAVCNGTGSNLTARGTLGATGGAETHTLLLTEIPAHTHTYDGVQSQGVASGLDNAAENSPRPTDTTGSTGGGQAHNNMQPFIVLRYLIKY